MMTPVENKTSWCELNFESSPNISPEDTLLKDLLKVLEETTKENEQKRHIKQVVDIYKDSTEQKVENLEAKNLLLEFFTRFNSKKLLKKYLQDVVGKSNLSSSIIKSTTDEILGNIYNKKYCNIKQCNDLLNFVYIMQNSATFEYEVTVEYLFPVYYMIFEGFVHHAKSNFKDILPIYEELVILLNAILKQILSVFVKNVNYIDVVSKQYSISLVVLAHTVLMHERIGFDLKTKCGLIFVHSFNTVPEIHRQNFKYKDCPPLELLQDYNEEKYFTLINNKMSIFKHSDSVVIIYASILSAVPQEKLLKVKINDKTLICLLYDGLMECARSKTGVPHIIVEISRTLNIIGKQLKAIPQDLIKPLFLEAISYVWSHIEHFVDTVRTYTRQFFVEIIMVAAEHKNNGYADLAEILLENVKQLSLTQSLRFLAMENIAQYMGCDYLLENFEDLQDSLLNIISEPRLSDQVCKTYISIMEKHFQEIDNDQWTAIWVTPVTRVLKNCNQCTSLCQRIITSAFQLHPAILRIIFPNDYVGNSQESGVLLKCLQYARHNGIELVVDRKENCALYWRGLIDKEKLEKFMIHQDEEIRISVLASIVESQKSTEVFLDWEFDFLSNYMHYNITSQTPNIRKQIISYYKKALARYNAGFYVIIRNIAFLTKKLEIVEEKQEAQRILRVYQELRNSYKSFMQKFAKQLISNLTFDANYYRKSTSLDLLIAVHKVLPPGEWLSCWTDDDIKNCHNVLFDSYETNKKMAVILLKHLPPSAMGFTNVEFTFKYMQRCLNMALDVKPSKALSAAYLLEVCAYSPHFYDIVQYGNNEGEQRQVHNPILDMLVVLTGKLIAQSNIKCEISKSKTAHYGIVLSIRHLLETRDISKNNDAYSGLFDHLVTICLNLKDTIMPVVCSPSPEGYIPVVNEEMCETDESIRAQMILVHAWRTVKEMSLLLAEIVRQVIKLENSNEMLSESLLLKIGQFFIEIFIESKHRGVFEQAYVGFSVICDSFWTSANSNLNCLPRTWLLDALSLCTGEIHSKKLCPTRRSAGLPLLILSILGTEASPERPVFKEAMKTLLNVCENVDPTNDECRIHSMNVLRSLFRHSKLGEAVSAYIAPGVVVAINGFKSDAWGIRNSATLLYSSLITRIFGVLRTTNSENLCMKNRLTVRVFFLRYPELFQFLLETLAEECDKSDSLVIHPILMILSRLCPSHLEEHNVQMEKYTPHVTACFSNPAYRTRDFAARAFMALINPHSVTSCLEACFNKIKVPDINDNECHGILLQMWHILKSNAQFHVPLTNFLQNSIHLLKFVGKKFSHMTVALYIEVVMLFLMRFRNYDDLDMLKNILSLLSRQIASNLLPLTSMSIFPQMRMLLVFYIIVNKFEETEATYPAITNQIMSHLYGHDIEMKRFCLNLLIYLNQLQNDANFKHALFQSDEMCIPYHIITLVDSFDKSSITKILTHIHPYLKCFLTEEIKFQHYIKQEDQVLLFLLVNYYPCVIKYLNLSKQETLNMLINFCNCDNEELISAVVSCISTFLLQLDYNVLRYDKLIQVLVESASPAASDYRRLAVCDFLSKNYILYCNEDPILVGDELQMVLNIVMVLLEDDDTIVRNAMSNFATALKIKITLNNNPKQTILTFVHEIFVFSSGYRWPVVPEKAKEDLLNLGSIILQKDRAICFIFSWACRHFPDSSNDASEIFERGELNLYAENVPFMNICAQLLHKLLWPLEDGLSYEDKSIFIEEHALLVTTNLLDALLKKSISDDVI
ncbi:hypothetical protein NQ314_009031 [Rhamnusium bicolor]|uniref:tRNA (32-2'-O)-methyltransferase regulator THADA n=1 Tax=Rhamnusium bicolor TaxID=1586634 RepID=A0AAV8Y4H5_9CUCU|nr:hypothetical protein NQ314_009031 [Rhamnusium bicolor]